MLKTAMEYLVGMGKKEEMVVKGKTFLVGGNEIEQIKRATMKNATTSTLTSIVDYLQADPDGVLSGGHKIIIQVVSPTHIIVDTEVNDDMERSELLEVSPKIPSGISYGRFYDMEEFNIIMQSRFTRAGDRDKLLALVGNVKEDAFRTIGDDGITQTATVKTGVASVSNVVVPNPVKLAPFRTFAEVDQPESDFVFRMQNGPTAALFEADGGAWQLEAIANIAEWLKINLAEKLGDRFGMVTILS